MNNTKRQGIYRIFNKVNGKSYIGRSLDIDKRTGEHIKELNKNTHGNYKLQKDWNNHGIACFTFQVLLETHDMQVSRQIEKDFILTYQKEGVYNLSDPMNEWNRYIDGNMESAEEVASEGQLKKIEELETLIDVLSYSKRMMQVRENYMRVVYSHKKELTKDILEYIYFITNSATARYYFNRGVSHRQTKKYTEKHKISIKEMSEELEKLGREADEMAK